MSARTSTSATACCSPGITTRLALPVWARTVIHFPAAGVAPDGKDDMSTTEDPWSPTGWIARLRYTDKDGAGETEEQVQAWGPRGEPLIADYRNARGQHTDANTLVDASALPHFMYLDIAPYRGNPVAAAPGWSVRVTHPNGDTEVCPVGAWMPTADGTLAPMVPGRGEYAGDLVCIGKEYDEPGYKFSRALRSPEAS